MWRQVLAASIAVTSLITAAAVAQVRDPQMHKGTVISAGGNRLVMKDTSGKEQSFTIEMSTKVTVNGKPGRLEDLQETMPVHVTTDERGKVLAVSTVDRDKRAVLVARVDRTFCIAADPFVWRNSGGQCREDGPQVVGRGRMIAKVE